MKLYLMRHGDAESITGSLSEQGFYEAEKVANFLVSNHISITQVYHSEKLRAQQTALEVAKQINPKPNIAVLPGLLPNDSVKPIAIYCNEWQEDTLLVGHLPFMSKLASQILSNTEETPLIDFHTAAMLCLERLALARWCIAWFIQPELLKV